MKRIRENKILKTPILKNLKISKMFVKISDFMKIFDFSDFRKFSFFLETVFLELFKIDFLHDEKIFFTQICLSFLIYIRGIPLKNTPYYKNTPPY